MPSAVEGLAEPPAPAPAPAPAVAAPRAGEVEVADGAGETKDGEAGAAFVEAQVEAGDSDACADREVVADPGVLGSAGNSGLGGVDAAAAADAVAAPVAAELETVVGEGGARNSSSPRHRRSKGTLSCCWKSFSFVLIFRTGGTRRVCRVEGGKSMSTGVWDRQPHNTFRNFKRKEAEGWSVKSE